MPNAAAAVATALGAPPLHVREVNITKKWISVSLIIKPKAASPFKLLEQTRSIEQKLDSSIGGTPPSKRATLC